MSPQLREFIHRVIVPALLEEWLEEHPATVPSVKGPQPTAERPREREEARA